MIRPEDVPEAFQSAWNAHDMALLGALFHEDATFVNRFAHYVRGVDEIVALHRPIHETIYRDSTLENELIAVDPIADGAATVHFWSRLFRRRGPSGRRAPGRYPDHRGGYAQGWSFLADPGCRKRHPDQPPHRGSYSKILKFPEEGR
jgi:uncharacterized protein (TIGR02246 family)